MLFPWQTTQWQTLWQCKKMGRLPHALLLHGFRGVGKRSFALHFVRSMLCRTYRSAGIFCDENDKPLCHSCRLIETNTHPNLVLVTLAEEENIIKIETIREAIHFINQTSFDGDARFLIIDPAHAMNHAAANALLKTLEEPSKGAMIILISHQSEKLPATIRSRCQTINFQKPEKTVAMNWLRTQLSSPSEKDYDFDLLLELANGCPLLSINFLNQDYLKTRSDLFHQLLALISGQLEPTRATQNLMDHSPEIYLEFFMGFLLDLLRLQLGATADFVRNQDFSQQLLDLKNKTTLNKNLELMQHIKELQQSFHHGISLNKQLAIESVLIKWSSCHVEELCI